MTGVLNVPLPLLQRLFLDLFGLGVVSFRLVALVPGILTLLLMYPLLRAFVGRDAAVLASCLLAVNPSTSTTRASPGATRSRGKARNG